ncbi:hypothetical protein [Flexithrix dorotheae]|uniref:hypothetical protein n=1 Tax=Flexithrix dorotheae TaxID=70993 RepID=UPI000372EA71|nr:hypothetical protein [Flexithrix dorotheae]
MIQLNGWTKLNVFNCIITIEKRVEISQNKKVQVPMKNYLLMLLPFLLGMMSCGSDEVTNRFVYTGGDANINPNDSVVIDFTVEGNLNVNGIAVLVDSGKVNHNLNLNSGGKVYIFPFDSVGVIPIYGDANINDSLFVASGIWTIHKNLNNNSTGKILNQAKVEVKQNLHQNGLITGYNGFTVDGQIHLNGGNITID